MRLCPTTAQIGRLVAQELENGVQGVVADWLEGKFANFGDAERELAQLANGAMRMCVKHMLESCDPGRKEIEWEGEALHLVTTSSQEYHSRFGPVTARRGLYRPPGRNTATVCPMEIRSGIIAKCWTPGAAYLATLVQTDQTVEDAHRFLLEIGVTASASTLGRLPEAVSALVEAEREPFEVLLREPEELPAPAAVVCASVDGVMAPMRDKTAQRQAKRQEPGKHGSGPSGYREIGCGAISLHDVTGERLGTIYYGRMPEPKKATVAQQLRDEMLHLEAQGPHLKRVYVCDGAEVNWQIVESIEAALRQQCERAGRVCIRAEQIVDFFHACQHLKAACDTALGEGTVKGSIEFEKLKAQLKESDTGTESVINALRYRTAKAKGTAKKRLTTELNYFRNQRSRMHYAQYQRDHLPIGSGVVEAACKTLVTQRMKRSGMAWSHPGGQAILTFNSWRRSHRFDAAWEIIMQRVLQSRSRPDYYREPRLKLAA